MRICPKCGGRLASGAREIVHVVAGHRFLVTISAKSCAACGTSYLDAASVEQGELEIACWLALRGPPDGAALRCVRKALGVRAIDVADLLGVTAETVSRWETGQRRVDRAAWIVLGTLLLEKAEVAAHTRERLERLSSPMPRARAIKLDARTPGRRPSAGNRISGVVENPAPPRRANRR